MSRRVCRSFGELCFIESAHPLHCNYCPCPCSVVLKVRILFVAEPKVSNIKCVIVFVVPNSILLFCPQLGVRMEMLTPKYVERMSIEHPYHPPSCVVSALCPCPWFTFCTLFFLSSPVAGTGCNQRVSCWLSPWLSREPV